MISSETAARPPLIVNLAFDGGCRNNPNGEAAGGAVLTSVDGDLLRHVGRAIGIGSNNVAEWTGLLIGLEAARDLGATHVDAVGDSELVVKQFLGIYRIRNENLLVLSDRVKAVQATFSAVSMRWTGRANNSAADAICTAVLNGTYRSEAATLDKAVAKAPPKPAPLEGAAGEITVTFLCHATLDPAVVREARQRGTSDATLREQLVEQAERRLIMAGQIGQLSIKPKRHSHQKQP